VVIGHEVTKLLDEIFDDYEVFVIHNCTSTPD
jgi:hypothetical protein